MKAGGAGGAVLSAVGQRSPTFLAPGTGFLEDDFSTDRGWEVAMVQAVL